MTRGLSADMQTGLRWGEMTELRASDISETSVLVSRTVQELHSPHLHFEVKAGAKNGKARRVQVQPDLAAELIAASDNGDLIFARPNGERTARNWFHKTIWIPSLTAAGISGVRVHDLRHTAISWWLWAGMPIESVRDRAGHWNISVTNRYIHAQDDSETEALAKLFG